MMGLREEGRGMEGGRSLKGRAWEARDGVRRVGREEGSRESYVLLRVCVRMCVCVCVCMHACVCATTYLNTAKNIMSVYNDLP